VNPNSSPGFLRIAALIAVPVGALGSVGFMFQVGHRNESVILMTLFTVWVLSPFLGLARAYLASRRWPDSARLAFYWVTLVIALSSPGIYGAVAFGLTKFQPAFFFLVAPLVSWLLIALVVSTAKSRKMKDEGA
jgi:hypothetical protein